MKTLNLNGELKDELTLCIACLLRRRGVISRDDTVQIGDSINIVPLQKDTVKSVVIDIVPISRALNHIKPFDHRIRPALELFHIDSVAKLKELSFQRFKQGRNVGLVTMRRFAKACAQEGIGDCKWIQELEGLEENSYQRELDGAVALIVTHDRSTWDSMEQALKNPRGKHTETQVLILKQLWQWKNSLTPAATVFPKNIHINWWKTIVAAMNQRFIRRDLPYRIKLTDDKVQIVTIRSCQTT